MAPLAMKMTNITNTVGSSVRGAARNARRFAPVFATSEPQNTAPETSEPQTSGPSTVFFGGKAYTDEEFAEAVKAGPLSPAPASASSMGEVVSLGDLMAFNGAPEIINGRLAMLAFFSAMIAEFASGESVLKQLADEPTGVLLTAIIFSTASLIPLMTGNKKESEAFGPFTPAAEMLNGRAAMIGFASLLVIEGVKHSALF